MSTNYEQSDYIEKRLRYFLGQFLTAQDFIDEQKYHIDRQRRGDRILKVSGICEGLKVTAQGVVTAVLEPGTAIDPKGRLVVLAAEKKIDLAKYKNKAPYLVISYQETESDPSQSGSEGNRRWDETPKIDLVLETEDLPQDAVVLAKLNLDTDGIVTVDSSVRQYSGIYLPSGDISGTKLGPTLRSGGDSHSNLAVLTGDLNVTGNLSTSGDLSVTGNLSANGNLSTAGDLSVTGSISANGNIGIGTANPSEQLEVSGNIKATGFIQPSAGNDDTSGIVFPKDPGSGGGDRAWIRYYARQGEDCTLEIGIDNDSGDHIALMPNAGNVGIGTTNPGAKLEVSGTLKLEHGTVINEFSTDENFGDNSDNAVPTEKAVKAYLQKELERIQQSASMVPSGTIVPYGGLVNDSAQQTLKDKGWLVCNGQIVSRDEYRELFDAIGTAFGRGDGSSTFHLPDLRGRFVRGVDASANRDPDRGYRGASATGGNSGNAVGSVQEDRANSLNGVHTTKGGAGSMGSITISDNGSRSGWIGTAGYSGDWCAMDFAKKGGETRPKNIYVNWIIKL